MKNFFILLVLGFVQLIQGQSSFPYDVVLTPVTVTGLPGLHSYAFGQHNGKWLIIGGRKDGLHARQPFNSFPENQNNTDIYVVDVQNNQFWSASLTGLSTSIAEQLQSTNMNFFQENNTLYIIGGYSYASSVGDHITHNKLTSIDVPGLIDAIINNASINSYFTQTSGPEFAISGGQLGKIGNDFYLVGGHQFDGRYNPMNNPTFTQTYSSSIRKFQIDNSGSTLSISNYTVITDAVHLHRRDYNLVPQVFPNGELGYTISSGVFQINADLPFLYPVDIKASGYFPQTQFNQYLSNYHSGKVGLFDANLNQMHSLFFGGMSQYYFENGTLIQDDTVPFVKTISRVSRLSDGTLEEYQFPVEMPNLKGSGAEFIPNELLPSYENEVIQLSNITDSEFVIGHLYGGILSLSATAFTDNQTNLTSADPTIYEVKLVYNPTLSTPKVDGSNPFSFNVYPNPTNGDTIQLKYNIPYISSLDYMVSSVDGKILSEGTILDSQVGENAMNFNLESPNESLVILTFIFDQKYFVSKKIIKK